MPTPILVSFIFLLVVLPQLGHAQGLPTISITTPDSSDIVTRDWHRNTTISVSDEQGHVVFTTSSAKVRARGHSTFRHPKKPYALRLPDAESLCGLERSTDWLLLANFLDHSLLRNTLALAIARTTSVPFTPSCRQVQVVLNGQWHGCYLLTGGVEVGKERVDLRPGEFLLESDRNDDGKHHAFQSERCGLPFHLTWPRKSDSQTVDSVSRIVNEAERAIVDGDTTRWMRLIDRDAFADWWLIHELTMNAEPNGPRSCYMIGPADGKLVMGPVWDFDLSFNPVGLDAGGDIRPYRFHRKDCVELTSDSLFLIRAMWYPWLLKSRPFVACLQRRWRQLRPAFEALVPQIDVWARSMQTEAERDQAKWGALDPPRFDESTSWKQAVENLKATYQKRISFLDRYLSTGIQTK